MAGAVIVELPNGPFAAETTPKYQGRIVDEEGQGIPASQLLTLTLTIRDTATGEIINGCDEVNILNTGRGLVNEEGDVTVLLEVGDTSMDEVPGAPKIQRSLVFRWSTLSGLIGRHQGNFILLRLVGG